MIREADLQATVIKQIEQSIKTQIESRIRTNLIELSIRQFEGSSYYLQSDIKNFVNNMADEISVIITSKVQDKKPASTKITGYLIGARDKMFTQEGITKYVENLLIGLEF